MAKRTSTKQAPVSELASLVAVAVAAPTPEAPVAKPKAAKLSMVLAIAKEFKPRTDNIDGTTKGRFAQYHNWVALVDAISASDDRTVTYEQAVAAVQAAGVAGGYEATCNARGFVQGRVRNGHLIAV